MPSPKNTSLKKKFDRTSMIIAMIDVAKLAIV